MLNKVTTASHTRVWPCTLGAQFILGVGEGQSKHETENVRWDNAHNGQHGGFRPDGRKISLEEKHSLRAGYWGGCGNSAFGGFMAQQQRKSSSL